ncbi:trypsin iota-like [Drosophila takahashii]|uniref:trypsin iota-like n=1 Tax=Drosophila takahashii TaxID=29030 RepID=UPI001CF8DCB0|nr:trypsin iota-like [Drosophila takahashii]
MFTKSLVLLLAADLLSAGRVPHPVDERIVCGLPIEKAPWQVSLLIKPSEDCGGVIYNKNIVLTTAHCVQGRNPKDIVVSFGSSTWGGGELRPVHEVFIHEKYSPETTYGSNANNIAVLLLGIPIPLGKNATPIDIADKTPTPGLYVQITGWSTTHLQGTDVKIEDHVRCQQFCNSLITEDMICANRMDRGPCAGKEGAALVSVPGNQLIGLSSWNSFCGIPLFDVYTNVVVLKKWLEAFKAINPLQN